MQTQQPANSPAGGGESDSEKLTVVAGPRGSGVGAGTRCAALCKDTSGAAVEAGFTLLTVVSVSVALTVQTHSCTTGAERERETSHHHVHDRNVGRQLRYTGFSVGRSRVFTFSKLTYYSI